MKVVIIGGGEIGRAIAEAMVKEGNEVRVVEASEDVARDLANGVDAQVIVGSGTLPTVQKRAQVPEADLIAVVTDRDADNVCAAALARHHNPRARIIARIRSPELAADRDFLTRGAPGLSHVLNPEILAAGRIFQSIKIPSAVEVSEFEMGKLLLVGVRVPDGSPLAGVTMAQVPERTGGRPMLFVARYRDGALVIPKGDTDILPGDLVYFITRAGRVRAGAEALGLDVQPVRSVLIAGATVVGLHLARLLHDSGISVKLVEPDRRLAAAATESVPGILVLEGAPTDPTLWAEESLAEVDALAAVCREEETNLMVALMGRRAGIRHTAVTTGRGSYVPLLLESGITTVVSPRSAAISAVLKFLRRGRVLQVSETEREDAELLEYEVRGKDRIAGRKLREIDPIEGAIVGAIFRDDAVIVPTGESEVRAGDRILVFARKPFVPDVERLVTAQRK